eukprot:g2165.t1
MEPLSLGGQDMSTTRMLTETTIDEGNSSKPNAGAQSTQHLEIITNPLYEQLVKLIFDGRMIGESPNRRSLIEEERKKALQHIAEARELSKTQGVSSGNIEIDAFLTQTCTAIESFNKEVTMTCIEAESTCNLFKKQIGSILSAGSIRATTAHVYTGDEAEMRARLKRKYTYEILSINNEISGRKKKGKLPSEATNVLKDWWTNNLVWPYPSEDAKKELEIQTGLSATQINNWFINQRKRHWHQYFKDGRLPQTINEARSVLQQYGIV